MRLRVTESQRTELAATAAAEKRVRRGRRYQALLLLADCGAAAHAAVQPRTLRCSRASVYAWAAAWRRTGVAGLREGDHGGGRVKLAAAGAAALQDLLSADPQAWGHQATGWTVPLLRTALARADCVVGERTIRRALHRLGYRWKRPRDVLGRPHPAYAEKKGS